METGLTMEREASLLGVEASIPLPWCSTPRMVTILQIQRALGLDSKACQVLIFSRKDRRTQKEALESP